MKNPPTITTRKVHRYGDGGLAVLIPARWARQHNVEKGSEVLVVANDRITIEPPTDKRIEELHEKIEGVFSKGER